MLSRGAVLLDICVILATIAQVALLSRIVGAVLLDSAALTSVVLPTVGLMLSTAVRAVLIGARETVGLRTAAAVKGRLRRSALAHLLDLGPAYVRDERLGELIAVLGGGLERLDALVSRYLPQRILTVTGPFLVAAYLWWLDPLTAILLLVTAPVIALLMIAVGSYTEERTRAQWAALANLSAHLLDVIQGAPTLKLFGRESSEEARVARLGETFRAQTMQVLRQAFLSGLVLEVLTTAGIAVVAVELGLRLIDGVIGFGVALQGLLLAPEFYRPLRELGASRHAALEGKPVVDRIDAVLRTRMHVICAEQLPPAHGTRQATPVLESERTPEIAFVGVSYRYPEAPAFAVDHVSFSLAPGTRTAIVGPSGAGKTTLVQLLARFLEPTSGTIVAGGEPITQVTADAWRQCLALVPQDPYLFDASVLDNLRIARPDATLEEVRHAAGLAGADEFLSALPSGYNTRLGERGSRLSRGQAQRLAIARALLKDAPLLILDEPTSALDPDSERVVRENLDRLGDGRTVLVVAHRLSTVATADQMIVLRSGRIAEHGSPRELLDRNGVFASLVVPRARVLIA